MKNKVIVIFLILIIIANLGGCMNTSANNYPKTINECIKNTNKEYSEITELLCDPGPDWAFRDEDYDLLAELVNLESISIIGIGDSKTAQLYFEELVKFEKLASVELIDSRIGTIAKLAEIQKLSMLSIIFTGISSTYRISDLDLLGWGSFKGLIYLKLDQVLDNAKLNGLPDFSNLTNLESLTVSGFNFNMLTYEQISWTQLISLDIRYTDVNLIDEQIADDLYTLESLDISHTKIDDVQFVLKLSKLTDFSYAGHKDRQVDLEPLRAHPNFQESWLYD